MKMSDRFLGDVYRSGFCLGDDRCDEFMLATFEDAGECDAAVHAINMHDELVEALEQTAIELHNCIQAINQHKAKKVSSLDLDPPDYHDFQTVHESMLLVSRAKS